jgi:hypothetical protein
MPVESEYTLENVAATPLTADKINVTFRSSTIGEFGCFFVPLYLKQCEGH